MMDAPTRFIRNEEVMDMDFSLSWSKYRDSVTPLIAEGFCDKKDLRLDSSSWFFTRNAMRIYALRKFAIVPTIIKVDIISDPGFIIDGVTIIDGEHKELPQFYDTFGGVYEAASMTPT